MPKEISKWPRRNGLSARKRHKANVHRPWPCASDTADKPLRPGRLPSSSERIAWERAGARMGRRGPIPFKGLWLCCVGRSSLGGKKGSHPFLGIDLPPRLARDPSALPPFRKFISAFALDATLLTLSFLGKFMIWLTELIHGNSMVAKARSAVEYHGCVDRDHGRGHRCRDLKIGKRSHVSRGRAFSRRHHEHSFAGCRAGGDSQPAEPRFGCERAPGGRSNTESSRAEGSVLATLICFKAIYGESSPNSGKKRLAGERHYASRVCISRTSAAQFQPPGAATTSGWSPR